MDTIRFFTRDSPSLYNDIEIYKDVFKKQSEIIVMKNQNENLKKEYVHINFFIEDIQPTNFKSLYPCRYNIFMPNLEQFRAYEQIKDIDIILCKTKETLQYFKSFRKEHQCTYKCFYTKFYSLVPKIEKIHMIKNPNLFICLAGKSIFKNVEHLIDCWLENKGFRSIDPKIELHISCYDWCWNTLAKNKIGRHLSKLVRSTTQPIIRYMNLYIYREKLEQATYHRLLGSANVCIALSRKEGYGHYINEARYFGTWILTMNNPPMNEMVREGINGNLLNDRTHYYPQKPGKTKWILHNAIPDKKELTEKIIHLIKNKHQINHNNPSHRMFIRDRKYFKKKMKRIIKKYLQE